MQKHPDEDDIGFLEGNGRIVGEIENTIPVSDWKLSEYGQDEITPMNRDLAQRIVRLMEGVVAEPEESLGEEFLLDDPGL